MISYKDNIQVTSTTTGTGTLTQSAAVTGFAAPAAGDDGKTFTIMVKLVDASGIPTGEWELCESVYTHSGTTWSRGTLLDSSTGSRVPFSSGTKHIAVVFASPQIIDSRIYQSEISITGATTATIGRYHVCSGTSADYTVTLPAASGNAGRMITLRMSPALTKLVTIDADGSELIDGALTRPMWANEVAVLLCDGTGWTKIGGKSIPLRARLSNSGNITLAANGASTADLPFNTNDDYTIAGIADQASERFIIPRDGVYSVLINAQFISAGVADRYFYNTLGRLWGGSAGSYQIISAPSPMASCTLGQYIKTTYNNYGVACNISVVTFLNEYPSW